MQQAGPPDPAALERRLRRERAARREAEQVAEQVTRDLYGAVQELAASRAALDETTDFVSIADAEGVPSYLNRALCELVGIEVSNIGAVNVVDLLTERSRARYFDEALPVLLDKGLWRGELVWSRRDGGEIAVSQVLIAHRRSDGVIERISSIARDVTEQQARQEELTHLALHDALTGLPNRRLFFDRLDLARARTRPAGYGIGVLFIDLDGFKAVNDRFGHDAGDDVLLAVASRLRTHRRAADTLARLGGDEFAVLCEDIAATDDAIEIAERFCSSLADPITVGDSEMTIGASIGIAVTVDAAASVDELLRQADEAMYQAKAAGKGCLHLYVAPTS